MFMKRQTSNYPPPLPYLSDVPPGGAPNLSEYDASYDVFMKKGMEGCDTFAEVRNREEQSDELEMRYFRSL